MGQEIWLEMAQILNYNSSHAPFKILSIFFNFIFLIKITDYFYSFLLFIYFIWIKLNFSIQKISDYCQEFSSIKISSKISSNSIQLIIISTQRLTNALSWAVVEPIRPEMVRTVRRKGKRRISKLFNCPNSL